MQLRVTFNLERLHCHRQHDASGYSEPYLWTTFWSVDITTIFTANPVRVFTSLISNRDFFQNDVQDGDDVAIPAPLGVASIVLDDGNLSDTGINGAACGCIVLLWEEDDTPDLKVHFALRTYDSAIRRALNDFVRENGPVEPDEDQLDEIIADVKSEVEASIRRGLSLFDILFLNFDDFLGTGRKSYLFKAEGDREEGPADLLAIFDRLEPEDPFSFRITKKDQDYEVFGRIRVEEFVPPAPDPCPEQLRAYREAVAALKEIDEELDQIASQIPGSTGVDREVLIADHKRIKFTLRPEAVRAVASALAAYEACRDRIDRTSLEQFGLEQETAARASENEPEEGKPRIRGSLSTRKNKVKKYDVNPRS
jgi:hypothetical protein